VLLHWLGAKPRVSASASRPKTGPCEPQIGGSTCYLPS
jgi:hypothetical protein